MNRWFWPLTLLLLAGMGAAMWTSAALESQNYDEGFHLAAGASYWKTGDFRLNPEHPPLAKLLCTLPVVLAGAEFKILPKAWADADQGEYSGVFLYENRLDADAILRRARAVTMALTLALGLAIALLGRALYSAAAGLIALAFFVTDPNFIAHGRYVTTDVPVTLFIVLAVFAWMRALDRGRKRDFVLAGALLGLALGAKFSALFLLPAHAAVMILRRRGSLVNAAITGATAVAMIGLLYAPATWRIGKQPPLAARITTNTPMAEAARQVATDFRIPGHPYVAGLWDLLSHNQEGHRTYLNGRITQSGSWLYFPTAFLVKTSTGMLLAIACAVMALRFPLWLLYPALYGLMSLASNLNIGVRHLLPVYPFLLLLVGAAFTARWKGRAAAAFVGACLLLQAVEVTRVAPHYLAFFNLPSGGPEKGDRYLLDSNLDWGQDGKKLAAWMKQHGAEEMCVSYFGMARLGYYGIRVIPIDVPGSPDPRSLSCIAAVSANNLHDLYTPANTHAWARELKPMDNVGHSILLYDLRKK